MASIEVGSKSKSIQYLSVSKSASAHGEFCSTDDRWSNPILHKQDDYLVALSRFEVPLTRVPITAAMDNCIQIFKYKDEDLPAATADEKQNMTEDDQKEYTAELGRVNAAAVGHLAYTNNVERLGVANPDDPNQTTAVVEAHLAAVEASDYFNMTPAGTQKAISLPACYTMYEFITKLNAQIKEALLLQGQKFGPGQKFSHAIAPRANIANTAVDAQGAVVPANQQSSEAYVPRGSEDYPNLFLQKTAGVFGPPSNVTEPMAKFEVTVDSDSTFKVVMNQWFAQWYYIKFSQELFDMLQFRETKADLFDRLNLPGRRFMGDRFIDVKVLDAGGQLVTVHEMTNPTTRNPNYYHAITMDQAQASSPPYTPYSRHVISLESLTQQKVTQHIDSLGSLQTTTVQRLHAASNYVADYQCTFQASNSAADSINRNKALIFSSSLATTSESVSGNTYRKIMTNFTIPISNNFSWDPNTMQGGGISEEARSTLIYTNSNPSGGRWLKLSDPSPLYELKMDVNIKVWDFKTNTFKFESVPLPEGSSFTCKLIFVSNNELYHANTPDSIHKT